MGGKSEGKFEKRGCNAEKRLQLFMLFFKKNFQIFAQLILAKKIFILFYFH